MALRREIMNYVGTGAIGGIIGYYARAQGLLGIKPEGGDQTDQSTEEDVGEDESSEQQDTEDSEDTEESSLLLRSSLNTSTVTNEASTASDWSLSAYHSPTPGVSGRFGDAWRFRRNLSEAGPDAIIFETPQEIDFDFSGSHDFSVKAHINPDSLTGSAPRQQKDHPNPFLFQTYGQYQVSVQLNDEGDGEIGFSIDSSTENEGFYSSTGESIPVGEWTSFVMTWDSSDNEAKLYINGVLELTENTAIPFESKADDGQPEISGFGARAGREDGITEDGDKGLDGRLDELQIYDTVLTEEQARTLHEQPTL